MRRHVRMIHVDRRRCWSPRQDACIPRTRNRRLLQRCWQRCMSLCTGLYHLGGDHGPVVVGARIECLRCGVSLVVCVSLAAAAERGQRTGRQSLWKKVLRQKVHNCGLTNLGPQLWTTLHKVVMGKRSYHHM